MLSESSVPHEEPILCPHFGECGGCQFQDAPYEAQLNTKRESLQQLLGDFWAGPLPITGSPLQWHYRNKVDFNFAPKRYDEPPPPDMPRDTVLGFNRIGKWYWPLDIETCLIAPEGCAGLMAEVRAWYGAEALSAFDTRKKSGLLSVLMVREGKRTGERMVMVITRPGPMPAQTFVDAVHRAMPGATVVHGTYAGGARGVFADTVETLAGPGVIEERLRIPQRDGEREFRFRISPLSFFQTNTLATEVLYAKIRAAVAEVEPSVLYDLYGGAGGIAFSCSDCATRIRSVESVPEATADGEHNAAVNGIDNVFFTTEKMKNYLLGVTETGGMEPGAVAVVDPPRAGMHPKALKRLIACRPERIVYVSCKPSVFAQELPQFLEAYAVTRMEAIDLFPHTRHVELLAVLDRR